MEGKARSLRGSRVWASVVVAALALLLAAESTQAQEFQGPPAGGSAWGSFLGTGFWSGLAVGDLNAGVSLGGGLIRVDHSISQGAKGTLVYVDFEFLHNIKKTDLRDTYFTLGGAIKSGNREILVVNVETNAGCKRTFEQFTGGISNYFPPGRLPADGPYGRYVLGTLYLSDSSEGTIRLDSRNQIWMVDATALIPIGPAFDFLLGYKWTTIKTTIDPFSQDFAGLEFGNLDNFGGWGNGWAGNAGVPSNTSFSMKQVVSWNGPVFGARIRGIGGPSSLGCWLDVMVSPFLFGSYEFNWGACILSRTGSTSRAATSQR